jgi:hypothetical protein
MPQFVGQQAEAYRRWPFGDSPVAAPAPIFPVAQGPVPQGYPEVAHSPSSAIPPDIGSSLAGVLDPQLDGSDYFFYVTNPGSIAPAATASSSIQIDAGTDFLWIATTFQSDVGGTAVTISTIVVPNMTVLITDTGATKTLSNAPVPLNSIAGTGEFPYRLIEPRLFRANSTINFSWVSYETATTYSNTYFVMHGIRKIAGTFNIA